MPAQKENTCYMVQAFPYSMYSLCHIDGTDLVI